MVQDKGKGGEKVWKLGLCMAWNARTKFYLDNWHLVDMDSFKYIAPWRESG